MGGDHGVHDREAEAGRRGAGGVRPGRVGPREPLEQVGQQVGRDAGAVVGDRHDQPGRRRQGAAADRLRGRGGPGVGQRVADPDGDGGAVGGVLARVGEHVGEHLVQPVLVAADEHRVVRQLKDPAVARAGDLGVAGRVDDQPGHVDRLGRQRAAGVEPGEQQQLVDQDAHPGRFRQHPAERVGDLLGRVARVAQRQLGVAADGRQRSAQLVRRVGGEPAQPGLAGRAPPQRGLHVAEHPVEGQADLAGLGRRIGVGDAGRQLDLVRVERQLGHLRRGGGDAAERAQREPDPEGPAGAGQQQHRAEDGRLGQRNVAEQVVQLGQRQAGDVDGPVAVGVADRGEQERAARPAQVARGGLEVLAARSGPRVRRLRRGDAAEGLLVGRRQPVGGVADDGGYHLIVPDGGDECSLGETLAHRQVAGDRLRARSRGGAGRGAVALRASSESAGPGCPVVPSSPLGCRQSYARPVAVCRLLSSSRASEFCTAR